MTSNEYAVAEFTHTVCPTAPKPEMVSLGDIFSPVLLDHYRHPRHYGQLKSPDYTLDGSNSLCGDNLQLQVKMDGKTVTDIGFTGKSCAICTASTSIFCEHAVGSTVSQLDEIKRAVLRMIKRGELLPDDRRLLGDAYALEGVAKLPVRVKCVLLVWETWSQLAQNLK